MISAPAPNSSSTGSRGYRRCCQYCLSFQASSQMVSAIGWPRSVHKSSRSRRTEVAGLVEDVVGRQQHLALPEHDLAALQHRRAVHRSLARLRLRSRDVAADHAQVQIRRFASQPLQLALAGIEKTGLLHQIARRITGQRKLRKHDRFGSARQPPRAPRVSSGLRCPRDPQPWD